MDDSKTGKLYVRDLTYDTVKESDILNIPETWTNIITLNTPERPAGTYVFGISLTYTFLSANKSAFLRFRVDGGVWNEFRSEPKDVSDTNTVYYAYPAEYEAGEHVFEVQMRKEDAVSNQLDVTFADLFFERKS